MGPSGVAIPGKPKSITALAPLGLGLALACPGPSPSEATAAGGDEAGEPGSSSSGIAMPSPTGSTTGATAGATASPGAETSEAQSGSSETGSSGSGTGEVGSTGNGATGSTPEEDALFFPPGLASAPGDPQTEPGATVLAFTLLEGESGLELYAAVRNDGEIPACSGGMMVSLLDTDERVLATSADVFRSGRFHRLPEEYGGGITSCVDPGETAMMAFTDFPETIELAAVASMQHLFSFFGLESAVAFEALVVRELETIESATGTAYSGTMENASEVSVTNPAVWVFPRNRVGRPLGMAVATAPEIEIPPGETWRFETSSLDALGAVVFVVPSASFAP